MSNNKKLYVIGSRYAVSKGKNDVGYITQYLRDYSEAMDVSVHYLEDLVVDITENSIQISDVANNVVFTNADLLVAVGWYYRHLLELSFVISQYCELNRIPYWNSEMGRMRLAGKLSTMALAARHGLPIPKTLFSIDPARVEEKWLNFPVVCKAVNASRGQDNFLFNNVGDLRRWIVAKRDTKQYIFQNYIPNDSDLRLVCIGGKVKLAIRRSRNDHTTHLNNVSQGAQADLLKVDSLDARVIEIAERLTEIHHRELSGVDILLSHDKKKPYVVMEVNPIPQLTSGSYVQEKMMLLADEIKSYLGDAQ
jgi:ribosomal protein S6--L-glutamate ligase